MRYVWIALIVALLVLGGLTWWFGGPQGPSYEEVAHLSEPRIVTKEPERVIVVTAEGDPNIVGGDAFSLLMKIYYQVEGAPKGGPGFEAPRARWPLSPDVPMDEWIGRYAIPVPHATMELPDVDVPEDLSLELTTWEYGEVAEILHVGPWDEEEPTVERLMAYIEENGYEVVGEHEEEYLKGPGMLFAGNPEEYLTIIRYGVRKPIAGPDSEAVLP